MIMTLPIILWILEYLSPTTFTTLLHPGIHHTAPRDIETRVNTDVRESILSAAQCIAAA